MNKSVRNGAIAGVFLVIFGYLYRATDLSEIPGAAWIFYATVVLIVGMTAWQARANTVGWVRLVGISALAGVLTSVLYAGFVYGYNEFIDDSLLQELKSKYTVSWQQEGKSESEITEMQQSPSFTAWGFAIQIMIMMCAIALVTSMLVSVLVRFFRAPEGEATS